MPEKTCVFQHSHIKVIRKKKSCSNMIHVRFVLAYELSSRELTYPNLKVAGKIVFRWWDIMIVSSMVFAHVARI